MKKKKVLSLLLAFSMVFGLAACGSGNDAAAPTTTDSTSSEEAADVGQTVRKPGKA